MSTLTRLQAAPVTDLYATWLHPASEPEAIDPNANDNSRWSWALSVTTPRAEESQQAVGWLCGTGGDEVRLVNFGYGEFALYRLLGECRCAVAAGVPNETAEAVLRKLGQHYGPGNTRLCGAYILISAASVV